MNPEVDPAESVSGAVPSTVNLWRRLRPWVVLVVSVLALWLLYRELRQYRYQEIVDGLKRIPLSHLWLAGGLTALNYLVLIAYDVLAIRYVGHPLALRKIAFASFIGYVTSYNFGATLGGGSVRFRLYAAWGLSAVEIVQLLATLAFTFWLGVFALAGVVFVAHPMAVPPDLHFPFATVRPLGMVLLSGVLAWLVLLALRRRPLRLFGWTVTLPSLRFSFLQIAVAWTDLLVAAAVFYVLLPDQIQLDYPAFLSVYMLAIVAVVLTHVPGGVGVFELVMLKVLAPSAPEALVASLVVFRVIYYLLPLLAAAGLFAAHEVLLMRRERERRNQ